MPLKFNLLKIPLNICNSEIINLHFKRNSNQRPFLVGERKYEEYSRYFHISLKLYQLSIVNSAFLSQHLLHLIRHIKQRFCNYLTFYGILSWTDYHSAQFYF